MNHELKPGALSGPLPEIAVVDWRAHEKGCLRGFVSVSVAGMVVLNGFKLFEKDGQRWVSAPAEQYKKKDGSTGYAPIVEFTAKDNERAFAQVVLADLDRYVEENDHAG